MHHRQIHSTEWTCRIRDGLPEFIPPPESTRSKDRGEEPAAPRGRLIKSIRYALG
jgi:hypothetical protein